MESRRRDRRADVSRHRPAELHARGSRRSFAAIADILGFLFLIVGIFWIIEAFAAKEVNPMWWMGA
jgi:hypothetical protein